MFVSCSSSPYCRILSGAIQLGWSGGDVLVCRRSALHWHGSWSVPGGGGWWPRYLSDGITTLHPVGCRQMPARLSANVYNLANKCQQPEIEVCEALGVVFPTSFGIRIMYQRSCSKPKTPFFSSKYEKSGANIWLYGKNYVPLQSQLRNGAFCNEVKRIPSHRGVEQLVARQAHNLEVARSSPASATITSEVVGNQHFGRFPVLMPDSFQTTLFSGIGCGERTM